MAEPPESGTQAEGAQDALKGGAYDHIRRALSDQAKVLRECLGVLDGQRNKVFGSRKLEIKNLEENRISTELSCEPRDMIQLGASRFLFGYNVELGLKDKKGALENIFSVYEFDGENLTFREGDLSVLDDENFRNYYNRLFDINSDATLSNRRVWADLAKIREDYFPVPDGMCLDEQGAIWVASPTTNEVIRIKEGGEILDTIKVKRNAYACMLGGEDRKTLFICTSSSSDEDSCKEDKKGCIEIITVDSAGVGRP